MSQLSGHHYAVVVAGGSGTRLWPLSRQNLPKQMQALMSDKTLIQETVERLRGVVPPENVFVSTTQNYRDKIHELLPDIAIENIIVEPVARGTSAAFALLANHLHAKDPDAIVFTLASDHAIAKVDKFRKTVQDCFAFIEANPGRLAIVGIKPTRPDTGLGYIKVREQLQDAPPVFVAEKFVEKPSHDVAQAYVDSGEYYWNAAYYCFAASTLLAAYEDADPRLVAAAREYAATGDVEAYLKAPEKVHEIEVIDSGKYPLAVVPADFTWSDIGNWVALHKVLSEILGGDLVTRGTGPHIDVNSVSYLVHNTSDRVVATAGLDNIVIVATDEAVFVVNMNQLEAAPEITQDLLRKVAADAEGRYL